MNSTLKSLVVLSFLGLASSGSLPKTFQRCKVGPDLDNKNDECLRRAVYDAIVEMTSGGVPALGVPDLDPLDVDKIVINQGDNSPIAIKLAFTNCQIRGVRNLQIDYIKGNLSSPDTFWIKASGHSPQLSLSGPYRITGKVLILPIQGQGNSNLTFDDVKAEFTFKGEREVRDGQSYLKVKGMKFNMKSISRLWMRFDNLFNGDKALGDNMNLFLNDNWQDIFNELRHSMSEAFGKVAERITKLIMEKVPYNQIFITN